MSVQALYQQKRMSATDAIRVVKNGDTIVVPTAVGEPPSLLTALSVTQTFADGSTLVLDARLAAVAVAAVALWLRAPFIVVVVLGALTAALLRFAGWG